MAEPQRPPTLKTAFITSLDPVLFSWDISHLTTCPQVLFQGQLLGPTQLFLKAEDNMSSNLTQMLL